MTEMLLTEIDHVAIAVNDLEAAIAWYEAAFGATVEHRETVDSDGVEEALLNVAESYVQLLTPTRDDSPVAKSHTRTAPSSEADTARPSPTTATASTWPACPVSLCRHVPVSRSQTLRVRSLEAPVRARWR